jgi:hypothetical protein
MLTYDANNVFLTLISSATPSRRPLRNPNQAAVGRVLDQAYPTATGDIGNVLNAIAGLSTAQAPAVLGAIGGQSYSGFSTTAAQTARTFMTSFANQTRGLQDGGHIALAQSCDIACDAEPLSRWGHGAVPGQPRHGGGRRQRLRHHVQASAVLPAASTTASTRISWPA